MSLMFMLSVLSELEIWILFVSTLFDEKGQHRVEIGPLEAGWRREKSLGRCQQQVDHCTASPKNLWYQLDYLSEQ